MRGPPNARVQFMLALATTSKPEETLQISETKLLLSNFQVPSITKRLAKPRPGQPSRGVHAPCRGSLLFELFFDPSSPRGILLNLIERKKIRRFQRGTKGRVGRFGVSSRLASARPALANSESSGKSEFSSAVGIVRRGESVQPTAEIMFR